MRTNSNWKCCENMSDSEDDNKIILCAGGKHYSKTVCSHCGHFKKWNPNPKIDRIVRKRNRRIDVMIGIEDMPENQQNFLTQLKNIRFPTQKQINYFEALCEKYLDPASLKP